MKIKKLFLHVFIILGISMSYHTLAISKVSSQGQSLSIYPPVIEIQTTPPSSPIVPITIQNNNTENVVLSIELIPFRTNNATGQVQLIPEEANKGFYPYYKDKIQFLLDGRKTNTLELQALEAREVLLNVNLEKGDPPGDFYFSIVMISNGEATQESSVTRIPAGIATNLLLSIGPKSEAAGGISQFHTSSFKSNGPVEFKLKLHNASRHLIAPSGSVEITNMIGQKVGSIKILPQYVLAGSDRFLVDEAQGSPSAELAANLLSESPSLIWSDEFILGWYKATATILLEENGRSIKATTYFVAFPTFLFFGLVIILFIIISIWLRVKKKI